ncbi:MAG TPA: PLP-dependent aminotransferase family protein [Pyrinomonadaceae bacterium]|nr:PLP-dependent aminotransferase family protein [Pyrinomonadaceae bacterium]
MKKQIPFILLDDKNTVTPLYRQVYESIRRAILQGELSAKTRLPSTRDFADRLGVSRITIVNAYEQLFAEGYLEGKTGAGTFVASKLPEELLQTSKTKAKSVEKMQNAPLNLSPFGEKLLAKEFESKRVQFATKFQPFQNGLTAIDEFPFEIWSRIAAKFHKNPPRSMLGYGDPQGFYKLREAVAAHLRSARGVNCTAEQVIITSGAQQALDLAARIFLSEKDSFLIENPCYKEARNSFSATGAKVVAVAVDEEGFNVANVPKTGEKAKLVYVTPSHQYPLGHTMTLARRLELIEWARKQNAWIIEDDYNSEFRYAGRPFPSLQGLDNSGRVIYVGTFSKTIFPALRIGCLVVPPELVNVFAVARAFNDAHSAIINQAILAEFITEGHFARHVRRMRQLYEKRQEILVREVKNKLSDFIEIEKSDAGMHLIGWLRQDLDEEKISAEADKQSIKLSPVSSYYLEEPKRKGFIFGYTAFDERQIKESIGKIAEIFRKIV